MSSAIVQKFRKLYYVVEIVKMLPPSTALLGKEPTPRSRLHNKTDRASALMGENRYLGQANAARPEAHCSKNMSRTYESWWGKKGVGGVSLVRGRYGAAPGPGSSMKLTMKKAALGMLG